MQYYEVRILVDYIDARWFTRGVCDASIDTLAS